MPSRSIEPTYQRSDRIVQERVDGSEVRRGDVVMSSAPDRFGTAGPVMQRVGGAGGAQWPVGWGFGPPGVALGSGPSAASASL
nr:S26 family signal peptidase [Streptomyces dangxiongensis]